MQRNPTPAETANQPTPIGIPNNADVALPAKDDMRRWRTLLTRVTDAEPSTARPP
jgi:hypothetical protein